MELEKVECIWWDGYHNAFTSIIKFRGNYFCAFRHGTEHFLKGEGEIYVLKSPDLKNWRLIKKFPSLKDSRDPNFFIFKNKLGVLFFAYPDLNTVFLRDAYISFSEDGQNFFSLIKISQDNLSFWKIRNYKGNLYATVYKNAKNGKDWRTYLFVSEDGRNFKKVSTILEGEHANESDLLFEDRKCYAIVRRERQTSVLAISEYPFERWERFSLSEIIMAPEIFRFKGKIFVAGRTFEKGKSKTAIFSVDIGEKKVEKELTLPSGGDTSYCGSIVENGRVILSYYSQHEIEKRGSQVGENASGIYIGILK